jgi:hypothetical protein
MDKFYIEILNNEVRLYDPTGVVFFILKECNGTYYTSQVYKYEPIVNELKDWTIQVIKENKNTNHLNSFSYHEIIEPMFKAYTREEKLNDLGI